MLSGYQCQVVAFAYNGEYICRECASKATSSVTLEKAERGLATSYDISPIIRYELDELNGQRAYEHAEERAREWEQDHPVLALHLLYIDGTTERKTDYYRLIDRLAEKSPSECCDDCGEELD